MTIKPFIKAIAALAVSGMMLNASANSVGLDQMEYDGASGTVSVTLTYDYSTFSMFGGGVDLNWDSNAIAFVSYTQAELADDAQAGSSPVGAISADGDAWEGAGVGTFNFMGGMNSAGNIGTFVFNVLGETDSNATACGMTLCVSENGTNLFVSLDGRGVGPELLMNGISEANVTAVPVPAAVWFMLSGLGALLGFGRKSA